jgi:hypothetical protein
LCLVKQLSLKIATDFIKGFIKKHLGDLATPQVAETVVTNAVLYKVVDLSPVGESDSDNLVYFSNERDITVKGFIQKIKQVYKDQSFEVRFLTEEAPGSYVWMHLDQNSQQQIPVLSNGGRKAQIILMPVRGKENLAQPNIETLPKKADIFKQPILQQNDRFPATLPKKTEPAKIEAPEISAAESFRQRSLLEEQKKQQKSEAQSSSGAKFDTWAKTEDGKLRDVRTLLSTVENVIWEDSGWVNISMSDLMMSDAAVKKFYRKAIILCHPDRHQSSSAEQQYAADRIFGSLNEAFKKFTN